MCESTFGRVVVVLSRHFSSDLCFCLQESEGGLYVCMNTFLGFGREHVERHYRKTGQSVYMHLKRHVKEVCVTPPPSRLGIQLVFSGAIFIKFRKGFYYNKSVSLKQSFAYFHLAVHRCVRYASMAP